MSTIYANIIHFIERIFRQKFIWNIPNSLSLYSLLTFPIVLAFLLFGNERIFVILLVINLVTDVLDGLIARVFHQETEIGARLDTLADFGTYILAILGVFIFKWEDFRPFQVYFYFFLGLFLLPIFITLIKFGRTSSLHLYSNKIAGYIQGFFFFTLFVFGFYPWFFWIMLISGYIAFSEDTVIHLISREIKSNAKGLFCCCKF